MLIDLFEPSRGAARQESIVLLTNVRSFQSSLYQVRNIRGGPGGGGGGGAAFAIVCDSSPNTIQQRILVVLQSPSKKRSQQRWMLPGGNLDPGETPLQAAVRELKEESGFVATMDPHSAFLKNGNTLFRGLIPFSKLGSKRKKMFKKRGTPSETADYGFACLTSTGQIEVQDYSGTVKTINPRVLRKFSAGPIKHVLSFSGGGGGDGGGSRKGGGGGAPSCACVACTRPRCAKKGGGFYSHCGDSCRHGRCGH